MSLMYFKRTKHFYLLECFVHERFSNIIIFLNVRLRGLSFSHLLVESKGF